MRPEVRTCARLVTEYVPSTCTQEVGYTVLRPEARTRMVTIVNMVPQVRTRVVPFTVMRAEVRSCLVNVMGCNYQTRSREVAYTAFKPETREQTVCLTCYVNQPYTVTVPYVTQRPEQRTHIVYQTLCRKVERSRQVPVTTYDTITKKGMRTEVSYKKVPYQSKETYTCQVPYEVDEEICVPVVRMKSVNIEVPNICPSAPCSMGPCEPCGDPCCEEERCFLKRLFH
jgi:hypothetical protein